ncbi:MFS transporter [Arenimonas sp. GDDSR-1]|uniref:MFS transporter n=1 Tax=Arenimonas sp. GDDSR-1 TaxID=2950125 RepID=UPI002604E502|nr:MFS transporter [Arenimonas sp. GDDSR-1]
MAHSQFELLKQRRFLPFFLTQALGAFNDNVFRNAMLALMVYQMGLSTEQSTLYANLAPALFILPYFLFSATAGQIAEKVEKARLIRITTAMEIAIMSLAAFGFIYSLPALLLFCLFLTGVQSTLFGPVKYAILPQVLAPEELTGGNGLVEMGTSISILIGMIAGMSLLMIPGYGPQAAAAAMIGLAVTGHLVSRAIPMAPAIAPELKINPNLLAESLHVLGMVRHHPVVRRAVFGVSWFWFVGTLLSAQLPNYAKLHLGGSESLNLMALALFSIGTGLGSLWCEKLSQRTVEIGLVPFGALGMSVFCADLYFARPGLAPETGITLAQFWQQAGSFRIMADLTLIGLFAGFFIVPLFALIQSRTEKHHLSRVIAGMNIQNAVFIVSAAATGIVLQRYLGFNIPEVFLLLSVLNLAVLVYLMLLVPEFFLRFLAWIYIRILYRIEVHGIEKNVPDEGPALLVCNHVSYMDALLLSSAVPRPIRFVMYYKIFNTPGARWAFKAANAIPIAGRSEDPELMERAFAEVDKALADGELVCIFPEGRLTPDGEIGPFKPGMERILAARPVPVVPMAIRGMWASIFSRSGVINTLRLPSRIRAHVTVLAEAPVDGASATAADLEEKVKAMRGEWA